MKKINYEELMSLLRGLADEYKQENNEAWKKNGQLAALKVIQTSGRLEGVVRVIKNVRALYER